MDLNLRPLLYAENPEERKILIERLFSSQMEPIVKQTIRNKFRSGIATKNDEEDVFSETLLRLWKQLQQWVQSPDLAQVADFPAYIAATTLNCCREYFRNKFPRRWHLRNRLRYLFTHSSGLSIWQWKTGEWVTGFSHWKEKAPIRFDDLATLMQIPEIQRKTGSRKPKLLEIVQAILRHSENPLLPDDLLALVISVPGVREQFQDFQIHNDLEVEDVADPRSNLNILAEKNVYLEHLWSEIRQLPLKQRAALLLNLRDQKGDDAITAFPASGTASISQIAEALEMGAEELAELWNDLPIDDARIAERLKLTRQQVINLRISARERLIYRMKNMAP
jgi:DNA-directed RNA polymerase specialized sigma24 family protein